MQILGIDLSPVGENNNHHHHHKEKNNDDDETAAADYGDYDKDNDDVDDDMTIVMEFVE